MRLNHLGITIGSLTLACGLLVLAQTALAQSAHPQSNSTPPALLGSQIQSIQGVKHSVEGSTWSVPQTLGDQQALPPQTGGHVSGRLEAIRRRTVDDSISRPFMVTEEMLRQGQLEVEGKLPAVPRKELAPNKAVRVATKPAESKPKPVTRPQPQPVAAPAPATKPMEIAKPAPVPAPLPVAVVVPQKIEEKPSDVLISNSAPALSFETAGPQQITIGKEATYRVTMHNSGKVDAKNLVVAVQLPAWAEVSGNQATVGAPTLETDDGQNTIVQWHLHSLAAAGSETLSLNIVPRDSRSFDLAVGWAFAPGQSMTQIQVQEPKLEMEIDGPRDVEYGDTHTYTITLNNPGTGDTENVVLNLMPISTGSNSAGSRAIGTLKAGERKSIELEMTAHQAGLLQIKAVANGEGGLRTEVTKDVNVRRAELQLTVAGPPRNFANTVSIYKIRIENVGDATSNETTLSTTVPSSANYISATDGGKFDEQKGAIGWSIGALRPGAIRVLELQVMLTQAGDNRLDMHCAAERDLSVAHSVVTTVEALADLKLFVNDPQGAIAVGDESEYEVRIVNRGTKVAENINVTGYFSEGVEPVSVRGWRGEVQVGQVVFEPIGTLAPGQEMAFRITAKASQPGNHVFRAEVLCAAPETRLATEEWTKYYGGSNPPAQTARQPAARPAHELAPQGHPLQLR